MFRGRRRRGKEVAEESGAHDIESAEVVPPVRRGRTGRRPILDPVEEEVEHLAQDFGEMPLIISRFLKMDPPTFQGTESGVEAELWLKRLEMLFGLCGYNDNLRLELMNLQLRGKALLWWEATERTLTASGHELNWEAFKEKFTWLYISLSYFRQRVEFDSLEQRNLSVSDYVRDFSTLLVYAPHVASSPDALLLKFLGGLRRDLFQQVMVVAPNTYDEAIQRALAVEMETLVYNQQQLPEPYNERTLIQGVASFQPQLSRHLDVQPYRPASQQPHESQPSFQSPEQSSYSSQQRIRPRGRNFKRSDGSSFSRFGISRGGDYSRPLCDRCGGGHLTRNCHGTAGNCYQCGQVGHFARACPNSIQF